MMKNAIARDLMTLNVVTVMAEATVGSVARLLAEQGISAVPVIDEHGDLVGVVSEADLIARLAESHGLERNASGWFASLFAQQTSAATRYAKIYGSTARDVMTQGVISVRGDATIGDIAQLLEDEKIRRVFVLETQANKPVLAGVVSRADLLRAVLADPQEPDKIDVSDERLRLAILARLRKQAWATECHDVGITVSEGVVTLQGKCTPFAAARAFVVLVKSVPGVHQVIDRIDL